VKLKEALCFIIFPFYPNLMKQYRVADFLGLRESEYYAFVFLAGQDCFITLGSNEKVMRREASCLNIKKKKKG
jgi:hypothetical protein